MQVASFASLGVGCTAIALGAVSLSEVESLKKQQNQNNDQFKSQIDDVQQKQTQNQQTVEILTTQLSQLEEKVDNIKPNQNSQTQLNELQSIAPAGQRDVWKLTSEQTYRSNLSGVCCYDKYRDLVYVPGNEMPGFIAMLYSTNGGETFLPCIFDVTPSGFCALGFNENVVVIGSGSGQVYSSTDGINFTFRQQILINFNDIALYIHWCKMLNMFFWACTAQNNDPMIVKSSDGIVWSTQVVDALPYYFESNDKVIIYVNVVAPYSKYSYDGIEWKTGEFTIQEATSAVAYSKEHDLFMAVDMSVGNAYVSKDGIDWDEKKNFIPYYQGIETQLMWVGEGINRWYVGTKDDVSNYSLWSTASPDVPFQFAHLDGDIIKVNLNNGAGIAYDASRQRFMMGLYGQEPGFVYSIPRPYTIKSVKDQIVVRGQPVSSSIYTLLQSIEVKTDQNVLLTPANAVGNFKLLTPIPNGMTIEYFIIGSLDGEANNELFFSLDDDNINYATISMPITGSYTGSPVKLNGLISFRNDTVNFSGFGVLNGSVFFQKIAESPFDTTINHNMYFKARLNNINGLFICRQVLISAHFR